MPWTEIIIVSVVLAIMGGIWVILDLSLYASQEAEIKTNQTHAENTLKALKKLLEPLEENDPESWVTEFPTIASSVANELHRMISQVTAYMVLAENFLMYARAKQRKEAAERYCKLRDDIYYKSTLRKIINICEKDGDVHIFGTQLHVKTNATVKNIFDKFRNLQEEMITHRATLLQMLKDFTDQGDVWGTHYCRRIAIEICVEYDAAVELGMTNLIGEQIRISSSYIRTMQKYAECKRNQKLRKPDMRNKTIDGKTVVSDVDAWIKEALLFEAGYPKKEVS